MSLQWFDRLRRKQQHHHRPDSDGEISTVTTHSKPFSIIYSSSRRLFILITISLCFFKNIVQALQPSTGLPPPAILQQLLQSEMDGTLQKNIGDDAYDGPILLPCCYDGLTARLIARHEIKSPNGNPKRFQATFMTGFGVSAIHGIPDTQLISYHEMMQSCSIISEALQAVATEQELPYPIPCIAVSIVQ